MPTASRSYRGASADERRAVRRQQFVDAGIAVFGTSGYRSATIESVSAEAGLIKRYFYESFDSLESLLCAVYEPIVRELREEVVTGAADGTTAVDAMAGAMTGFLDWAEAHPRKARVQLIEVLGISPRVDEMYRLATKDFAGALADLVEQRMAGDFSSSQRDLVGTLIVGAGLELVTQWVLDDFDPPKQQLLDDASRVLHIMFPR